jgi:multiple sugar transport system ATP-binding protein
VADIALQNVGKRFGDVEAMKDLSISIADGEFLVILGPSGAGKTTLLRLVAGLERPDSGSASM